MSDFLLKFKEYLIAEGQNPAGISPSHGHAPEVRRQGTVVIHDYHRTPIHIQLSDGTSLFLTRGQYEMIGGVSRPERGAKMEVTLQRHPGDKSGVPSLVVKAVVTSPPP